MEQSADSETWALLMSTWLLSVSGQRSPYPASQANQWARCLVSPTGLGLAVEGSARAWELFRAADGVGLPGRAAYLLFPRFVLFSLLCYLPWSQTGLRPTEAWLQPEPATKACGLCAAMGPNLPLHRRRP